MEEAQEKNIFIHSNDPDFPIYKLTVLAKVKLAVIIEPPILKFSDTKQEKSKEVTFKNNLKIDLIVSSIGVGKDIISYRILNAEQIVPLIIKPNQNLDIMITPKIKNNTEPLHTDLTIHTDYIDYPIFTVPVYLPKYDL